MTLEEYKAADRAYMEASKTMSWAECLQLMIAARKAWSSHFGPALKARDKVQKDRRDRVIELVNIAAKNWDDTQRREFFEVTGISA